MSATTLDSNAKTIAALYVQANGCYFDLEGVDPWDVERDARLYRGPYPVVAHPPCTRWCKLAKMVEAKHPHLKAGQDNGEFESALRAVREYGGVLEHPAYSMAWVAYGLNRPPSAGGWVVADWQGGWTCCVEQAAYGHQARKRTWLYSNKCELKSLRWGMTEASEHSKVVGYCRNYKNPRAPSERLTQKQNQQTPKAFRDLLIEMARSCYELT